MFSNFFSNYLKVEYGKGYFTVYEGGSDKAKLISSMTGKRNGEQISIPGNQMFVVFHTNGEIAKTKYFASIVESKYINKSWFFKMNCCPPKFF